MRNFSNLIRFSFATLLIGISILAFILVTFLHLVTIDVVNHKLVIALITIVPLCVGLILLLLSIQQFKKNSIASLEIKLINLAKRQNGIVTISDASTKLNKSLDDIESGFKSLQGKDIFEIRATENGGLEYHLLS